MFDKIKFRLGTLCKRGHDYEGTGKSLRHLLSHKICVGGQCRACKKEYGKQYNDEHRGENKKYREGHKKEKKDNNLRVNYGITLEDYFIMYDEQKGKCLICGEYKEKIGKRVETLHVDHDHETGKVRGLLCLNCNHLLGKAKDNIEILLYAIKYLQK